MLREGNELRQGSKLLIEGVELIRSAARPAFEAAKSIQRTVDAAIVREVHHALAARDQEINAVLVGVNM